MNKYLISFVNKKNVFNLKKYINTVAFNLKNSDPNQIKDEPNKSNKESNLDESESFGIGSRFSETNTKFKTGLNNQYKSNFNKNKSFSSSFVKNKIIDEKITANEVDDGDKFGTLTDQLDDM
jgi:hypothetical protein